MITTEPLEERHANKRLRLLGQEHEGLRRASAYLPQATLTGKKSVRELAIDEIPVTNHWFLLTDDETALYPAVSYVRGCAGSVRLTAPS